MKRKIFFSSLLTSIFLLFAGIIFYSKTLKKIRVKDLGKFKKENLTPDPKKKRKVGNITIVELEGTPYEIGYQNGVLMKEEITSLLQEVNSRYLYVPQERLKSLLIRTLVFWLVRRVDPHIPPKYRQEMQGVADGAGLSYNEILLINTIEEALSTLNPIILKGLFELTNTPLGCSSVFVGKGEKSKQLIVGQTVDFPITLEAGHTVLHIIKKSGKKTVYMPSFPGIVLLVNGVNEDGLVLTQRATPTGWGKVGTPILTLTRQFLEEAGSLGEGRAYLAKATWSIPRSLLLADSKNNQAAIFEVLPGRQLNEIKIKEGCAGAANHFKTPAFHQVQMDALEQYHHPLIVKLYHDSQQRESYLTDKIKKEAAATPEKIATLISGEPVANQQTVQAIVFVPEEKVFYLADGLVPPVTQGGFVKINLKP